MTHVPIAWRLPLLAISIALAFNSAAAEIHPLQLTGPERGALETSACTSRHQVALERAEGQVYGKGSNAAAVAEVHCASHAALNGSPLHYVVQCARSKENWECQGEWIEVPVAIQSNQVAVRVEGEMKPAEAASVVSKIAGYGRFQGYVLRDALASPCYVNRAKDREFIDVKCQGWHMIVSNWCPQQPAECPRLISIDKQI
ncbi:MAG: hypothetical protein ACJ8MH_13060 [Povalibacter sp.]